MIIILLLLIKSILVYSNEYELINPFSSIKTRNSAILLNSSFFDLGDKIYIDLKSKDKCEYYIGFQFFDDINSISNSNFESKLYLSPISKSDTDYTKGEKYFSLEFQIDKRREYLNKIKGDILYLEYDCRSEVEVINNKYNKKFFLIVVILFLNIICMGIFLVVVIKAVICCLITLNKIENKIDNLKGKNDLNKAQINYKNDIFYSREEIFETQGRIIHIMPSHNLYNNNAHNEYLEKVAKNINQPQIQILES